MLQDGGEVSPEGYFRFPDLSVSFGEQGPQWQPDDPITYHSRALAGEDLSPDARRYHLEALESAVGHQLFKLYNSGLSKSWQYLQLGRLYANVLCANDALGQVEEFWETTFRNTDHALALDELCAVKARLAGFDFSKIADIDEMVALWYTRHSRGEPERDFAAGLIRRGYGAAAMGLLTRYLYKHPLNAEARELRALCILGTGNLDAASHHLRQAFALQRKLEREIMVDAIDAYATKDFETAQSHLGMVVDLEPDHYLARAMLAHTHFHLEQYRTAREMIKQLEAHASWERVPDFPARIICSIARQV